MRAVWITRYGGPEVLEVREGPDLQPGPGDVRIRVRASGLNFSDLAARQGLYPDAPKPPCVTGYEVAGVVDALGAGVEQPAEGSKVIAATHFGGHSDTVIIPAAHTIPMPEDMSFEQAAALPVNYLVAYHMLFAVAGLRDLVAARGGARVLIHMAAGGVGMALLQLCRTVDGVETFGTASAAKHAALLEEGCAHPIDYRTRDYAAEVMRLTGERGVDIVLDPLGGRDWGKGYRLLRPAGRLIVFGFANMIRGRRRNWLHVLRELLRAPRFSGMKLMNGNRGVLGVHIGHLWNESEMLRREMQAVLDLWRAGKIAPRIDTVYSFADAAKAHEHMHQRLNIGKVLLRP